MSIKERFVKNALEEEGTRFLRNQGIAIKQQINFHTGTLYGSRTMQVKGSDNYDGQLTFTHTARQRFLDMRRKNKGRKVGKARRRIHNRFIFGHYSAIASRLMYDLTDDVVAKYQELEQ